MPDQIFFDKIKKDNFPSILIVKSLITTDKLAGELIEQLKMPFTILDFEKKNHFSHC